eukprot:TRINITY_DN1672_c0_g1_i1.p1 TRINITY_DN1672_c0_g1~~TRINITY_DN1672_c0_g1_i1.p1  ORF type:complete len:500 (-),score=128.80 TRINITY_DN1672_c0_g1_i1:35-1534(-)
MSSPTLKIQLKIVPDNKDILLDIDPATTVGNLKQYLEDTYQYPYLRQSIIQNGRVLKDEGKISTFQDNAETVLIVLVKKKGSSKDMAVPSNPVSQAPGTGPTVSPSPPISTPITPSQQPILETPPVIGSSRIQSPMKQVVEVPIANAEPTITKITLAEPPITKIAVVEPPVTKIAIVEPPVTKMEIETPEPSIIKTEPMQILHESRNENSSQEVKKRKALDIAEIEAQSIAKRQNSDPNMTVDYQGLSSDMILLVDNPSMSDVTFLVGTNKQKVHAHSFVLGARSKYFRSTMFSEMVSQGDKVFEIPEFSKEVFRSFLQFLYSGTVLLNEENAIHLLNASHKYQVKQLREPCLKYCCVHLTPERVLDYLIVAKECQEEELTDLCFAMLDEKTEQVLQSESLLRISKELFSVILSRETLTADELELFMALLRWKEKNELPLAKELARLVRVPQIDAKHILNVVKSSKLVSEEILFSAMAFRAAPDEYVNHPDKMFQRRGK